MRPAARFLAVATLSTALAGAVQGHSGASAELEQGLRSAGMRLAQAEMSAPLRERLQQQNSMDTRRRTIAPVPVQAGAGEAALSVPTNPQETDKLRRVQRLIEDMEKRRGTAPGTVKVRSAPDGALRLEHDVSKTRGNLSTFGASPFGGDLGAMSGMPNVSAVMTSAEVEYRVEQTHTGGEQVVGIRASDDVAATAFKSGEAPVSLEVTTARLTAQQVEGAAEELPVNVRVGDDSRQMRAGDVARFGNVEVVIQASSNRSAQKLLIEGAPYALRLQVRSVQ